MLFWTLLFLPIAFANPNHRELKTTDCNFDTDFCIFNNTCSYDWTRLSGSTPSVGTGPSSDHTTGSGYYVYVEASSPNYPFKGPFCLDSQLGIGINRAAFYYHMYGSDIGTLNLKVSSDSSSWSTMWSKTGEQGDAWQFANVSITYSDALFIRFEAETGVYFDGDIAIDDVILTETATISPTITPAPSFTFRPTSLPTLRPSPSPSTVSITSELQLTNAVENNNAVVNLADDIYLTYSIYIVEVDIILNGNGYKLDGQQLVRCLIAIDTDLTINYLTITNGYSADGAGFLSTSGSILHFYHCIFNNNIAPSGDSNIGGAIRSSDCTMYLISCLIYDNYAPQGGGVALTDGGIAVIYNTSIYNNIADDSGGGVYVEDTELNMTNCSIINNEVRAGSGGGMFFTYDAIGRVSFSNISYNTASVGGGGVLVDSAPYVLFYACSILSNKAWLGGGFMLSSSVAYLETIQCEILFNQVNGWSGGGVYIADGQFISNNNMIANNSAIGTNFKIISGNCTAIGGCFYSPEYPSDYLVDEKCSIEVNNNGSLDAVSFSTESGYDFLTVNSIQYSGIIGPDCEYVEVGDVITFVSDQFVVSGGFEICNLKTPNGGGLSIRGGEANLVNTTVYGNLAARYGGGLHIEGGTMNILASRVSANQADGSGDEVSFVSGNFDAVDLTLGGAIEGVSANAAECVSACAPGEYANCSIVTADCFVNCHCFKCPLGTASSVDHATSNSVCEQCAAGKTASEEGSRVCTTCELGKYATDDATEDSGGLDYQVALGATICNDCPAGYVGDEPGLIVCDHCEGGYYSLGAAVNCSKCSPGKHSHKAFSECRDCNVGRYNPYYANEECFRCDEGYSSDEGDISCDDADIGYYLGWMNHTWSSMICPDHTTCLGGDYLPIPKSNYWVDRSKTKLGGEILPCFRETCKGASLVNVSCWSIDNYNDTTQSYSSTAADCDDASLLCSLGAYGPLCGACSDGFTYYSTSKTCVHCRDNLRYGLIILCIFGILGILYFIIILKKNHIPKAWKKSYVTKFIMQLIKEDDFLRVLFSSFQIIQSVSWTTDTILPDIFKSFLNNSSFISFDFIKVECIFYNSNIYTTVYIWSLIPIIISLFIYIILKFRIWIIMISNSQNYDSKIILRRKLIRQHLFYFLTLTYLVLPPVTRIQFQALDCMEISGQHYLRYDTSVNCNSHSFVQFVIIDCTFIVLYMSVPFIWLWLLYKRIKRINPIFGDVTEILRYRMIDPGLRPIKFLFDAYKPNYWYFESLEMLRRITFVSIIPLLSSKSPRKSAIGFCLAIVSSILYREMNPFRRQSTNFLMQVANGAVTFTFGVALVISTKLANGNSRIVFGILLLIFNLSVFIIAILLTMGFFYQSIEKSQLLIHRKLNSKEIDNLYNFIEFKNNEQNLSSLSLPPSSSSSQNFQNIKDLKLEEENNTIDLIIENNNSSSFSSSFSSSSQLTKKQIKTVEQKKYILNYTSNIRLSEKDVTVLEVIGHGSFGLVCYGKYKSKPIIVRSCNNSSLVDIEKLLLFKKEINKICFLSHRNIIQFYGLCYGIKCVPCALFEFMPRYTLASILNDHNSSINHRHNVVVDDSGGGNVEKDTIKWEDPLFKWAMDIARGMTYLHDNNLIMEKGLCPEHVLINDLQIAKIDCFGLKHNEQETLGKAQWGGKNAPTTKLVPYIAPEVMRNVDDDEQEGGVGQEHRFKQDVYSYGMLLLTMALDVSIESYLSRQWTVGSTIEEERGEGEGGSNGGIANDHVTNPTHQTPNTINHNNNMNILNNDTENDDNDNEMMKPISRDSEIEDVKSALEAIWEGRWHPMEHVGGFPSAPKTICDSIVLCCDQNIEKRPSFRSLMNTLITMGIPELESFDYQRGQGSSYYHSKQTSSSPTSSPLLNAMTASSPPAPPSNPSTPPSPLLLSSPSRKRHSDNNNTNTDLGGGGSNHGGGEELSSLSRLEQRKSEVQRLALYRRISSKTQTSFLNRPTLRDSRVEVPEPQDIELAERTEV